MTFILCVNLQVFPISHRKLFPLWNDEVATGYLKQTKQKVQQIP